VERTEILTWLEQATTRLTTTVDGFGSDDLTAASLLPGWDRAHVLTHLARNADARRSLLLAARSGEQLRMYASVATRTADIETGAHRPAEVIMADLIESGRRFGAEARAMPDEAWSVEVLVDLGQPDPASIPAERCVALRLVEVEIHHVDLAASYRFEDTPEDLAEWLLTEAARRNRATISHDKDGTVSLSFEAEPALPRCRGAMTDLLAWTTGRSEGIGVEAEGGILPHLVGFG